MKGDYEVAPSALEAFAFLNKFFPVTQTADQKGIVLRKNGEVIAAALYVENNGTNVFVHLAGQPGSKWLTKEFLYWGFHYPFEQLKVKRMTCWVEATNTKSIRFCEHVGWTREAVLQKAGTNGVDVYIFRMFREDCKYV